MQTPGEPEQPPAEDGVGRQLAGRYRVTGRIGRGGMGVVWRAVDEVLGREVALKELRTYTDSGHAELADLRTRMQREARAAARVRHPGVIAVHDIAQHEGRPVIVMELVDGPSLAGMLQECGTLAPAQAAGIGAGVLDALAAAHQAGVLHRDVKPGNILLERSGRVVLTDFGIAAVEEPDDGAATRLTASGELVGSLDYLAPERARGEQPGPASDVWALGATLYAAVEGISPFRRTGTWSTLTAIVADPLPEPRRAGPLGPALTELMHKDPAQRAGAERASALLSAVAAGTPLPQTAPDTVQLRRATPGGGGVFGPPPPADGPQTIGPDTPAHAPHEWAGGHAPPAQHPGGQGDVAPSAAGGPPPVQPAGNGAASPAPARPSGHTVTGGQPGLGGTAATGAGERAGSAAEAPDGGAPRRRRRIALTTAAVLLALLGATAGTYALLPDSTAHNPAPTSSDQAQGGSSDDRQPAPSASSAPESTPGRPGAPAPGASSASGSPPGQPGAGAPPAQPQACSPIANGRHNCDVWQPTTSYDAQHTPVGMLRKGTNYFYCQAKLPQRETSGRWTNVWWAKTDDDSGHTGVFVSAVYLRGGQNDQPVPGLPVC